MYIVIIFEVFDTIETKTFINTRAIAVKTQLEYASKQ